MPPANRRYLHGFIYRVEGVDRSPYVFFSLYFLVYKSADGCTLFLNGAGAGCMCSL